MDMTGSEQWSSSSSSSYSVEHGGPAVWTTPPKRPAGRTKFKETRHPVYRGVRRRGNAGRWVCEVRVPGQRGERLWLGTYLTAESAARAHDAAMLGLHGRSASACLNFADSAWLLDLPSPLSDLAAVRRVALAAVVRGQCRKLVGDIAALLCRWDIRGAGRAGQRHVRAGRVRGNGLRHVLRGPRGGIAAGAAAAARRRLLGHRRRWRS
uniref:CBF-like transcription factor n=1 Tax=Avena sativa TaxID=4498 RepID=Q4A1D0_AVESA|nr:CBF-like transcription factor [Avena sativa]